ncbi:MAG: S41 family peptidase [Planctomycetota bacterium]
MDRRYFRILMVVAACASCPAVAQAPWTVEQMAEDLDQIAAVVKSDWSYAEDHRRHFAVDVDALLAAAKSELHRVRSADDFARLVRRIGVGLQDGHAYTFVPGQALPPARRLPFRLASTVEGLCVVVVPEGSPVERGDLLVAIEGVPVEERITALARDVFASTKGMRRRAAIDALHRTEHSTVRCAFVDAHGERRELELTTLDAEAPLPPARPAVDNWTLSWPRPSVALLHLSSFAVPRWQEWLAAKPEDRELFLAEGRAAIDAIIGTLRERNASALLVDLRGNGGGTDLLGIHLAERLLAGEFRYFQLSAKHDGTWSSPAGLPYGKGDHARFSGQVVALVDEGCFSTTDNFLRCLDDLHPKFTAIGRPTGGGTGAPRRLVETTHTKAVVGACTQRVYGPMGRLTEGRGTEPFEVVTWTRADWLRGRDPDLEAALRIVEAAAATGGK